MCQATFCPLLPQELVQHCVWHLRDSMSDLRACALISTSWTGAAQRMIYNRVSILAADRSADAQSSALAETLQSSPHLIQYIRCLEFPRGSNDTFTRLCSVPFTNLDTLGIHRVDFMSPSDAICLQQLLVLPTLRQVELDCSFNDARGFYSIWAGCSPNIRHLRLRASRRWIPYTFHPIPRFSPVRIALQSLRLAPDTSIDDWLSDNHCPFDFSCLRALAMHTEFKGMHPISPTIQVLDYFLRDTIDFSSLPNLSHLRISSRRPGLAARSLQTLRPSRRLRTIVIHFILPYRAACVQIDSILSALHVQDSEPPTVELEMGISNYNRFAPCFVRLQAMDKLKRRDPACEWFADRVEELSR
ncbi:hypothetical protein DFH09DRAFT_1355216 [Mycena vulgaris]|nr:hypothetical protein DFH09DRAFT_1355216 [Mycena vulgaris]